MTPREIQKTDAFSAPETDTSLAHSRETKAPFPASVPISLASIPALPFDLTWLDSIDPETEAHLLPTERAILAALRDYRRELAGKGGEQ